MKLKLLFSGLLYLYSTQAYAQTTSYQPMLSNSNTWYTLQKQVFTNSATTQFFLTTGDTIAASNSYKKLSYEYLGLRQNIGGLREDIATKKVYFRDFVANTEFLIYDFSLSVGNLFEAKQYDLVSGQCCVSKFIRLDSIKTLAANTLNRVFYFTEQNTTNKIIWVEAVGSLAGIMYAGESPNLLIAGELVCAQKNALYTYRSNRYYSNGNQCQITIGNKIITEIEANIRISPNPIQSNRFFIQTEDTNIQVVAIYDILGRLIKQVYLNSSNTEVELSEANSGLYILHFYDNKKNILAIKKISKL